MYCGKFLKFGLSGIDCNSCKIHIIATVLTMSLVVSLLLQSVHSDLFYCNNVDYESCSIIVIAICSLVLYFFCSL